MSSRACGGGVSGRPAARPRRLAAATTPSWSSSRPTSEPLSTAMPARLTTARVTATSAPRPGGAVRRRDAAGRDRPGADVLDLFGDLHRAGSTVLMISHDAVVASRAGRRLLLDSGRLVAA